MLQSPTLPESWRALLDAFRPAFRRSRTFALFALLATGLVTQTTRRTVVGMLAGAGMAAAVSFHAVCRFFSHHAWDTDRIGLTLARLIVSRLLDTDAAIEVVVDDTLFRRWGPKVFGAFWTHDGSAQDPNALGRGNRWIIIGIVVTVPFCSHPVCLPVLFRLWRGKGTASPVQLARELISILAQAFPDRLVHAVGDAAYHGKALLVPATTITTRLPANAALYALAPPRTGKRGRPRSKGARLGRPVDLAATAQWRRATITRYGRSVIVEIADIPSIWYGAFGNTPGRTVLVRDPGDDRVLAVFTTAVSMAVSALNPRFRDTGIIWSVAVTALFYATPVLYPIELIGGILGRLLALNPLAPLFELARKWVIDPEAPGPAAAAGGAVWLLIPAALFVAVCAFGIWIFNREAPRIAEEL